MTQNRPYRRGLDLAAAAAFMRELVAAGRLDGELVERLLDIPLAALAAAQPTLQPG